MGVNLPRLVGARVARREDPRLLTGQGSYVDDHRPARMLYAAFLRSPHAHARIVSIDTTTAASAPGVIRVLTFRDLERWMKPLQLFGAVPAGLAAVVKFDIRQAPKSGSFLFQSLSVWNSSVVAPRGPSA